LLKALLDRQSSVLAEITAFIGYPLGS